MASVNNVESNFNNLNIPTRFSFPYLPELFTEKEKKILLKYFTNIDKPVFAIHNLPQEVVGAMFSRYSRSSKSVRRLFLDEFWEEGLIVTGGQKSKILDKAKERTQNFYKRVFAEFGDDSVIQMGSLHIGFEFVSQLIAAKAIEDQRIGAAYIEKSTRYVDFGSKYNNRFLFMIPEELKNSRFENEYISLNNELFEAYIDCFPKIVEFLKIKYPLEKQFIENVSTGKNIKIGSMNKEDKEIAEKAYERALKAKAYDTVRFFLPLSTVTNLGAHFSGQTAELAINKMLCSPYSEVRYLGLLAHNEMIKVSPNFMQNVDHKFGGIARDYRSEIRKRMFDVSLKWEERYKSNAINSEKVSSLIYFDKDADIKLASQILYVSNQNNISKKEILKWAGILKKRQRKKYSPALVKIIKDSICDRNCEGRNRRQKLPRAFEHVFAEVEFYTDIATYKDLQRNRMSTTERQLYGTSDIYIPPEYKERGMEKVLERYLALHKKTKRLHDKINKYKKNRSSAEYVCLLGNKVRFNIKANLRQWVFFAELRTVAGGHPTYRHALQEASKQIIEKIPFMKDFFTHVDWKKDYGLGRMKAEVSTQKKLSKLKR